jgi:alpha-galactosidase
MKDVNSRTSFNKIIYVIMNNLFFSLLLSVVLFFGCSESTTKPDKKIGPEVPPINKSLALKPPMGWNSWDCFGFDVNESEVKASADFMAKNLKSLGYEYIVLDMNWYAPLWPAIKDAQAASYHIDSFGRLLPDTIKFPSSSGGKGFKPLADYVHSVGLRFGIHILGGIPKKAVDANCPVKGTSLHAQSIIHSEKGGYWYESFNGIDLSKPGGQEYYNSIFELYAQWGVDFIKADYLAFQTELIGISRASRTCGRDMIISAVPDRIPEQILRENAHMARTGLDLWDQWEWLKRSFFMAAIVVKEAEPGYWPDMDMLPVGKLTVKSPRSGAKPHMSNLTTDEKYSLFSLWYISRMPLFIGGYLPEMDSITLALISNKEALEVNRNSSNNHQIYQFETDFIVWTADIPDSKDKYFALFNISDKKDPLEIGASWEQLGLTESTYNVRDLWGKKNIGAYNEGFKQAINSHGAGLFRVSEQ